MSNVCARAQGVTIVLMQLAMLFLRRPSRGQEQKRGLVKHPWIYQTECLSVGGLLRN